MKIGHLVYDPSPGMHVGRAIEEAITLAQINDAEVRMKFNGTDMVLLPTDNAKSKFDEWNEESRRQEEEYKKSPAYLIQQAEWAEERRIQTERLNELWENKPNFKNLSDTIDWLNEVRQCDVVNLSGYGFIELLEDNGYVANANTYENFKPDDMDNSGRWLVGQAMSCVMSFGQIHPIFEQHAKQWKQKFEGK